MLQQIIILRFSQNIKIFEVLMLFALNREEKCEFLPFMSPKEVVINEATGRVSHLLLARTEQDEDTGEWKIDEEEVLKKVPKLWR